jgi:hypothetical protein
LSHTVITDISVELLSLRSLWTYTRLIVLLFSRGNTSLSLDSALPFLNREAIDPKSDTPDNSNPENTNQNEKSPSDRAYDENLKPSPDLISLKRND